MATRLRATLAGSGSDLVVMAHGLGTDQSVWDGVLATMPHRFTALRFDLPGVSPRSQELFDPISCRSLAPYADELLDLLDEIGAERCSLVGHSVSGMIAMLAALEAPERFQHLITINTSPRYIDGPDYTGGFTEDVLAGFLHTMATDYQAWVAGFARTVIPADAPEALDSFTSSLATMRPDIAIAVARIIFGIDLRSLLDTVAVPVTLIHSRHDPAVPPAVGHFLQAHLTHSRLLWIDAEGHLPHLSAPGEIAALVWSNLA